jgi:putative DNA primase/helicase
VSKIHVIKMIALLEEVLAAHPACKLVNIDPISAYLDGTDSHTNAAVRGLLAPLAELAAKFKVAIVAVSHLNKGGGQTSAMYRITASLAFVAAARAVYAVIKDKDDEGRRLMLPVKNNLSADRTGLAYRIGTATNGAPRIKWEREPVTVSADEAMAKAAGTG